MGGEPEGIERTPDGAFVYVTSEEDNEVFVIDPAKSERRRPGEDFAAPAIDWFPA